MYPAIPRVSARDDPVYVLRVLKETAGFISDGPDPQASEATERET